MDAVSELVAVEFGGAQRPSTAPARNVAPFVELEWGSDAYAIMRDIKKAVRSAMACSTRT